MFVHALSGAASFAACLRLFRSYPLAVNLADGGNRTIVLRHGGFEGSGFYLLTQDPAEHFTLRPWRPQDGPEQQIRPGTPVTVASHRVVTEGMPVPRHGALLGWLSDRQATALISVYHGPAAPQARVLAVAGSEPMSWPPFTVSPLDDGRLWEYAERGQLVDLAPVIVRESGAAFWVPSQNPSRAREGHGCVVVSRNLQADDYWVPAGLYLDHWMLREGVPSPTAGHLLGLPGATGLARHLSAC